MLQAFSPRTYPGMGHLVIRRQFFDEVVQGKKTKEFREDSKGTDTVCQRPYLVLRNGRTGRCPYIIVKVTGSSESSREEVKEVHGEEALSIFKTDKIRAIHLGQVVEVYDPKKPYYFKCKFDLEAGPCLKKTTTPKRYSERQPSAGPLPLDLHVASLTRRDLSTLPQQSLTQAFDNLLRAIKEAEKLAMTLQKEGRKPLLWEDSELKVGTRFSGLGSTEEVLAMMEPHVRAKFKIEYACDTDSDSFKFYKNRFMSGAAAHKHHFFDDVTDLVKLDDDLPKKPFSEKKSALEKADMASEARCKFHRKNCKIPWTHMDVSGSVCKDYSAQGSRAGCEGKHALSMLTHFQELRKRRVPIRISENVVSAQGQASIASAMPDCQVHYLITMPEDCGTAAVRRDRGWLVGVSEPYRFIRDPNEVYAHLASILAASQVPQSELWFDDEEGQETEMKSFASRWRPYQEGQTSLQLGFIDCCLDMFASPSKQVQHNGPFQLMLF